MVRILYIMLAFSSVTQLLADQKNPRFFPDLSSGSLNFFVDNDIFNGTDQDYTSGMRVAWISDEVDELNYVPRLQRKLGFLSGADGSDSIINDLWGFENTDKVSYQYGVALTQQIFTPEFYDGPRPLDERPYAAWLGFGFSLHASDQNTLNSVTLNLGVVGPAALGEQTQDFVHRTIDSDFFDDWDSEIPNEFTINLDLSQKRQLNYYSATDFPILPLDFTSFSEVGVSLGNRLTAAKLGWHFKLGYNIPNSFSNPKISPTSNPLGWKPNTDGGKVSCFFIAGVEGQAVLHDITIDGPLFRDFNTHSSSEPLVLDYYYGATVKYKSYELTYTTTARSREFKQQDSSQKFGSLIFRMNY